MESTKIPNLKEKLAIFNEEYVSQYFLGICVRFFCILDIYMKMKKFDFLLMAVDISMFVTSKIDGFELK